LSLRLGTFVVSQAVKTSFTSCGNRTRMNPAIVAPASREASSIRSSSWSFRPGIIGEASTPQGIPAAESARSVSSLRPGDAARGSRHPAKAGSSVVIETMTFA